MNSDKALEEAYKMLTDANSKISHIWLTEIVFSWRWWFGVALTILPWVVWIIIRDKKNTVRLLFVGLVAMIIAIIFDNLGLVFGLWHYHYKITPCGIAVLPWDFTLFPVGIMLILQFNPNINAYIKALVFALFTSLIFEPFFVWMKMYHCVHYKCWYSFFIYIPLYLFFNYIYKSKLFVTRTQ